MPSQIDAKVANRAMPPPVDPKLWNGEEYDDAEQSRRELLKTRARSPNK